MNNEFNNSEVYFFHGKESRQYGSKYTYLTEKGYHVISPDFYTVDIEPRLQIAEKATENCKDMVVVGSSLGGLIAALLYNKYPERFKTYLLLAPAFHLPEADVINKVPPNAKIIHGDADNIVLLKYSIEFASKFNVELEVVQDDHRLSNSFPAIDSSLAKLLKI